MGAQTRFRYVFLVYLSIASIYVAVVNSQFDWHTRDAVDEVQAQVEQINEENCHIKHIEDLHLPYDTVSHKPDIKDININPVFPNRTALLHLHNMALNRAFFWSYALQSRFIRPSLNVTYDPGMMYYFLSSVADVASNPKLNASAVYFSPNMSYTSSYRSFFNKTLPLFAPRAFRADDYNDPIHLERYSTLNTLDVRDLGAIPSYSKSQNYTSDFYRINDWYKLWLPDRVDKRQDTKTTYQVRIRYANNTNETFTFHGPPGADEVPGPVLWTRPYFDCGRSNKWVIGAVSPIADIFPRHTGFRHIEYPTYTAVSVMEMDLERIDINQCPRGPGNDGPNHFNGTDRCKETTECEPIHGYGLRRGGYQCRCKPGYRLPNIVRRPYLGEIIERATDEQYKNAFQCEKIGWIQKLPHNWQKAEPWLRAQYMEKYHYFNDQKNSTPAGANLNSGTKNIASMLNYIKGVNPRTCKKIKLQKPDDLILHGDVGFGAESQFENEAKMAVRLANFYSAYLQIVDHREVFTGNRIADRPLSEDQVMAETLALVLGNTRIWGAGTFWDRRQFPNRTLFAPYAYKEQLNTRKFKMEDLARLNKTQEVYTNKPNFKTLKSRFSTNFDDLEKYYLKIRVRSEEYAQHTQKYEQFPISYRAAEMRHGWWSPPYFDCGGFVEKWVVTYSAPFFGWDSLKTRLQFKGVVSVTMDLEQLDINQCPTNFHTPNAFKDTNKCDRKTSYCVPILGRGFEMGGYKCECIQGYEYPFEDSITYYDGQLVEAEFQNLMEDKKTRYDMLKCRLAGASTIQSAFVTVFALILTSFYLF
ncbi:hypothetical protein QYM36_009890, partial [Artemia franciscana]